ncbi:MAG: lysophospholipid acyltransferase family protein [Pseudomonadota bacterium]
MRSASWLAYALVPFMEVITRPFGLWSTVGVFGRLGGLVGPLVPQLRARIDGNLDLIHPDWPMERRRRLIADCTDHFSRLVVEYLHLRRFVWQVTLEVDGMHHLEAAAAEGRGVLIVTAHYGNWEAIRVACLRAGLPSGIIYRPFNNRYIDDHTLGLIVDAGTPVMQKGPKGLRSLARHLSRGGRALLLADQRTSHAPQIPFLGHPAETLTVAPALAQRTGALLVTARARRLDRRGRFHVRIEAPLPDGAPEDQMREVNRRIGAWIAEDPSQWFWLHHRWKLSKKRGRRAAAGPRRRTAPAARRDDPHA